MSFYVELIKENETSAEIVHFLWGKKVIAWEKKRKFESPRHKAVRVFEKDVVSLQEDLNANNREFIVFNDKESELLIPLISTCINVLDGYYNNDMLGLIKFLHKVTPILEQTSFGLRFIFTSPASSERSTFNCLGQEVKEPLQR